MTRARDAPPPLRRLALHRLHCAPRFHRIRPRLHRDELVRESRIVRLLRRHFVESVGVHRTNRIAARVAAFVASSAAIAARGRAANGTPQHYDAPVPPHRGEVREHGKGEAKRPPEVPHNAGGRRIDVQQRTAGCLRWAKTNSALRQHVQRHRSGADPREERGEIDKCERGSCHRNLNIRLIRRRLLRFLRRITLLLLRRRRRICISAFRRRRATIRLRLLLPPLLSALLRPLTLRARRHSAVSTNTLNGFIRHNAAVALLRLRLLIIHHRRRRARRDARGAPAAREKCDDERGDGSKRSEEQHGSDTPHHARGAEREPQGCGGRDGVQLRVPPRDDVDGVRSNEVLRRRRCARRIAPPERTPRAEI